MKRTQEIKARLEASDKSIECIEILMTRKEYNIYENASSDLTWCLARIEKLESALNTLRADKALWKSPRAGGQDQYAGLPGGYRLIDAALKEDE